jgi:hypothetical protein
LFCDNPEKVNKLAILNISGTIIHHFDITQLIRGKNIITWNSELLKGGIYFLVYNNGISSKTLKLIKE